MLVTIITVAYNSEKTIAKTLESVLNQTYSDIEYIIVDGASSDGTVKVAKSFVDKFAEKEGRILKIISEPDKGMYDALNKGAGMASGEIVGQVNADDWYEPDAVEKMVKFYKKENYDVAWGNLKVHKPSGEMIKYAKITLFYERLQKCYRANFSTLTRFFDHRWNLNHNI